MKVSFKTEFWEECSIEKWGDKVENISWIYGTILLIIELTAIYQKSMAIGILALLGITLHIMIWQSHKKWRNK